MENQDAPEEEELDEFSALVQEHADAVNRGDVEEQEATALRMLEHAARTQDDSNPWLQALKEAHQCETAFDWVGAEEAFKRAVESADQPALQSKALGHLSAFYDLVGLDVLAEEAQRTAHQIARQSDVPLLHHLALMSEAKLHLKAKDVEHAFLAIAEASVGINDEPMHNLQRARISMLSAACFLAKDDLDQVESDLTSAWDLLEPYSQSFFLAGWQSGFAFWWESTARLRARRNDLSGAVSAWREVVERRRIIAQCPQLEGPYKHNWLAVALRGLAKSLREAGESRAEETREESDSIRRSIGLAPLER